MMIDISRFANRWRNIPVIGMVAVVLLLLVAGIGVILLNESAFHQQKLEETKVQAEVLAAGLRAALDFDDRTAAQETIDALRINPQIRAVAVYNRNDKLFVGYTLDPARLGQPAIRLPGGIGNSPLAADAAVISGGKHVGWVRIYADPQPLKTRLGRYLVLLLLIIMAALVVAVLGSTQAMLQRANRVLAERADALAISNTELQLQIDERARAEEQLHQAQKLQAMGQLTGGIAHDFNNLLTVIQGSADLLMLPNLSEAKRLRYIDAIAQAGARAAELTGQLLAFARRQPLQPETIDVNELVGHSLDLLCRMLGEQIEIRTRLTDQPCLVEADRAQLISAALNLAVNARDAMPEGGALTMSTDIEQGPQHQPMVALTVRDNGTGMDKETLARAMEPFFTTKGVDKGTGLGLSQVYGFASQSGGDLRIRSAPGEGTTVSILLPRIESDQLTPVAPSSPEVRSRRSGTILLVEDNDEVGAFAETLLGELGHRVTRAQSGKEALALIEHQSFDVIFTDVVMPAMSGLELAERIRTLRPGIAVVLTTGYSDEIAESGTGGLPVLLKPYRFESLARVLNEAMGVGIGNH